MVLVGDEVIILENFEVFSDRYTGTVIKTYNSMFTINGERLERDGQSKFSTFNFNHSDFDLENGSCEMINTSSFNRDLMCLVLI